MAGPTARDGARVLVTGWTPQEDEDVSIGSDDEEVGQDVVEVEGDSVPQTDAHSEQVACSVAGDKKGRDPVIGCADKVVIITLSDSAPQTEGNGDGVGECQGEVSSSHSPSVPSATGIAALSKEARKEKLRRLAKRQLLEAEKCGLPMPGPSEAKSAGSAGVKKPMPLAQSGSKTGDDAIPARRPQPAGSYKRDMSQKYRDVHFLKGGGASASKQSKPQTSGPEKSEGSSQDRGQYCGLESPSLCSLIL